MSDVSTAAAPRRARNSLEKACDALDWPWFMERLVELAGSGLGQERVRGLAFTQSLEEARRLLQETSEIRRLVDENRAPPLGGISDVRAQMAAAAKGEILVGRDFTDIAEVLAAFGRLQRYFSEHEARAPRCAGIAAALPEMGTLALDLRDSFDAQGELSTLRYPELGRLRQRLYAVHSRVRDHLSHLLDSPEMEGMIQDRFYTVRSDRYVIPLKVQHKNVAEGIIHDASGSGQTVFMEPASVIPLNNELKLAEGELKREERRILIELSQRVADKSPHIRTGLEVAAEIELITARARMSQELVATEPRLNDSGRVHLLNARHPVLALRGVEVVPNDISVGEGHQAIVISGPNTGGKTVALKTLGLCALMVRAGLHVPAEAGSEIALFRRVLTDIGDTQTIEGDLSTFSGHITSIRDIVLEVDRAVNQSPNAGLHTLVLLDEIAVGTDPTQGSALAQGILGALVDRGCRVVVTTHYAELKTLSTRDPRFTSARVDYDGMKPTYRLKYGVPGRSFALDIARRLGLHPEILDRAESLLSPETLKVDELVGNLEAQLHQAQTDRDQARIELRDAESLRTRYERRLAAVEAEVNRLRRDKLKAFDEVVAQARDDIRDAIKAMQGASSSAVVEKTRERVRLITKAVKIQVPQAPAPEPEDLGGEIDWATARPGDAVTLVKLRKQGELVSAPASGPVEVLVGGMKIKLDRKDLRSALPPNRADRRKAKREWTDVAASTPSADGLEPNRMGGPGEAPEDDVTLDHALQSSVNTLDLRGERVDSSLDAVDRFLDAASLRGEGAVFIIHGHGTGKLRDAIRQHLGSSPYADRFQPGGRYQGGNGVTVVGLR